MDIYTKGNVIVNRIQVGDVHYEYVYGLCIKSKVVASSVLENGFWSWWAVEFDMFSEERDYTSLLATPPDEATMFLYGLIHYTVNSSFPSYYSVNLYDYPAYQTNI